ncbi:MAG: thiol-disulfide oxidoreductase DCC family protein [Planctomycetota bacterium]
MSELLPNAPLVLFDGVCNLCNGAVQFILRRDPAARFRFASLQSAAARTALAAAGVVGTLPDSIVLLDAGRVRVKSGAALAIARGLRFPWPLLTVFWLVPSPLRDLVYDWIARNRYRWFGKREQCWVPTRELRARFLDAGELPGSPQVAGPGG